MNDKLEMPATLAAYLGDPAVRTAVDALLDVKTDTLPSGISWKDLDTYYRARGGAELTRHDTAHFLSQLWKKVWSTQLGPHWVPAPFDELIKEKFAVTPATIWEDQSFTTYHYQKPYILFTDVNVQPDVLSIAFSIEINDEDEILMDSDFAPFRWSERGNDDWDGWQVYGTAFEASGDLSELGELISTAREAYAAIEMSVAAHRTKV